MRWIRFRLKTLSGVEDLVIAALTEAGVEGVEIEDHVPLTEQEKEQMFVDILPDSGEDDGTAWLSFYVEEGTETAGLLARVREALDELRAFTDIGECTIEESLTEDLDWVNNWKQYFHQFRVDDILITPSWEPVKPEDEGRMIIHIDPGTAFGTGMHETTQLCIRALKKYLKEGMRVLDVGTGSGILSIAALKLGASHAAGTDLDPCAVSAVEENLEANGIPKDRMDMWLGNLIDDEELREKAGFEAYDIVVANILAEVLVNLTPHVGAHLKHGGVYIMSGILDIRQPMIEEAVEKAGLTLLEVTKQGEWVCVCARRD